MRAEKAHLDTLFRPYAPARFTRVGLLYRLHDDDAPAGAAPPVLPLHGRATNRRAIQFNYRTRSDTYNAMALNVYDKTGTDCTHDDCDELYDGDVVEVRPHGRYRVDIDRD